MVTLEKTLGIPTVTLVAQSFHDDFLALAGSNGIPKLPPAVVAREFTSCSDADVRKQAEGVVEEVIRGLCTPIAEAGKKITKAITTPKPSGILPTIPPTSEKSFCFTAASYEKAFESMQLRFLEWGWSDGF